MSAGKIQLTMTDRPRPPQPPANDDLEAPREIEERGLRGIGERMSGALRGATRRTRSERMSRTTHAAANDRKASTSGWRKTDAERSGSMTDNRR